MAESARTRASHWDETYDTRGAHDVSWFEADPRTSVSMIERLRLDRSAAVLDVGGGASRLVDRLLAAGHRDVTVLDVSQVALDLAADRLGDATGVRWVRADVTRWTPDRTYALWHDRAVFHFLTADDDRTAYLAALDRAVPSGSVVLATFAPDGPTTCSGLPVRRYGVEELTAQLPDGFEVVATDSPVHRTPWDSEQPFTFVAATRS